MTASHIRPVSLAASFVTTTEDVHAS